MVGILFLILALYYFFDASKRYLSAFFLFALATAGFQFVPVGWLSLQVAGLSKSYDWMLLFLLIILLLQPLVFFNSKLWKDFKHIKIFLLLLIFLVFYSVYIQGIEFSVTMRVCRNFLFVLFIFVFCSLTKDSIEKVFRLIVYTTSLASLLYCLQAVVGVSLLNNVIDDYSSIDLQVNSGIARFYNLPIYVMAALLLLLFDKTIIKPNIKWLLIIPNAIAIVLSQHRNLILAVIVCLLVYYIIKRRVGLFKIAVVCVTVLLVVMSVDKLMDNRLTEGFTDLQDIVTNGLTPNELMVADLGDMSTTQFRLYVFYERWNYITQSALQSLFGIGLVTEDSYFVKSLNFNIGLSDDTGHIVQVDTSDIAWSSFIIYFGIAGTFIFLSIYANLLKRFYTYRVDDKMVVGFLFVINLLLTSFYSITIFSQSTLCLLMLFAAYQYRLKQIHN